MGKIAYLDLEFKDKKERETSYKQPTEFAYAWFSNKKKLNFKTFHFEYEQDIQSVFTELRKAFNEAKKKYNFDTLVFWDSRQDLKVFAQAKVNTDAFQIDDLQQNIAEKTKNHRLSLLSADKLFNLNQQLIQETKYLKVQDCLPLKLHTAVGDATRIALIHREFEQNQEKFIKIVQNHLSSNSSEINLVALENKREEIAQKKQVYRKSILQNITLDLEKIKRIKEGILLLLSLEQLTEEERQIEEEIVKTNKNYQLVKKLQENNYDVAGFTTELLRINRFLSINFKISLKQLYELNLDNLNSENEQ